MSDKRSVYIIHNLVTKRNYVGSSGNPEWRVQNGHFSRLRQGRHNVDLMQADYDMYGHESFEWRVLGEFMEKDALNMEIFYMKLLRTQIPELGYNYKDNSGSWNYSTYDKQRVLGECVTDMPGNDHFSAYKKYKELIKERGITSYRVGKDTGIAQSVLSAWSRKGGYLSVKHTAKLAKYLGVPMGHFLD